ncbi:MAG: hypothetical protein M1399_08335, partial [Actinobacteria bacterium]|nr:hypothetical protein [Actinomycetota bacterium]MCL5446555.1 hypothetical protein [Actinomycetota bacterium]
MVMLTTLASATVVALPYGVASASPLMTSPFTSPPAGSALNNDTSITPTPVSCAGSSPNSPFTFAPGFVGVAQPNSTVSLPSGMSQYLFVGAEAGGWNMEPTTWTSDLTGTAQWSGNPSVDIGRGSSDSGSFSNGGDHNMAIAELGISGYSVVGSPATNFATQNGPGSVGGGTSSAPGSSVSVQYTATAGDIVVILVGGQGTGLVNEGGTALTTLVNDTYSECGANVIASVAMFAGVPGAGTFTTTFTSTTYLNNSGTSLGVAAYILQPASASGGGYSLAWAQQSPTTSPPGRGDAPMAYDAASGQVVLFGGEDYAHALNDTWTYDGTTWTQQSPATSPPAMAEASGAYDAATKQFIIFGGCAYCTGPGSFSDDMWAWDGTNWTQLTPATMPAGRDNAPMAFDPATNQLVLFGGSENGVGNQANDTWTYDGSNWTQQTPATSPPPLADAAMAYDAASQQLILFGGGTSAGVTNETWAWDGTNWTQLNPSTSPPGRDGAGMTYDAAAGVLVLFGGNGASTYLNDTWVWDGKTWHQADGSANGCTTTCPGPSGRSSGPMLAMAYDPGISATVLFGGNGGAFCYTDQSGCLSDTWTAATTTTEPDGSGLYHPMAPVRLVDTRCAALPEPSFCAGEKLPSANAGLGTLGAPQSTITAQVAGVDGIPSSGVSAVAATVTATNTTGSGYLTIWPAGE